MKHGLQSAICAAVLVLTGCGHDDHEMGGGTGTDHHHASAHGGVAVELGEHQYHLDFLHDATHGVLTAWVMDAHVENFVRVATASFPVRVSAGGQTRTVTLTALAKPSTGETAGDTSQFQGEADWLKGLGAFDAVIEEIDIRGNRFRAVAFSYPASRR